MRAQLQRLLSLGLIALLSVLAACASPEAQPSEMLKKSMHRFHVDFRWKRFDEAAAHLPIDQREAFLRYYDSRRRRLFITEYDVEQLRLSEDETVAEADVMIRWYELPSNKVFTSVIDETWHFDEETRRWELVEQDVQPVDDIETSAR